MKHMETSISLDRRAVRAFFDERARRVGQLGPIRAVIYQDQDPELAEQRHREERRILIKKLALSGGNSVIDLGCGTGRWAATLVPLCASYIGVDFCAGLLEVAKEAHRNDVHARFILANVTEDLVSLLPKEKFDRILSLGVMIYLNDDEMLAALDNIIALAAPRQARIVLREPVGIACRVTLQDHFSQEMSQNYNAIYRAEDEFLGMLRSRFEPASFRLVDHGKMYRSTRLNNRVETIQKWFVFER
jgi:SAM-dependent methyltransferase